MMIVLAVLVILFFLYLFFYNEKYVSHYNHQKKIPQILWRFFKIVVIPVTCFIPVIFLVFLLFGGGKIFIENTISEDFDGKIIYKRGNHIFYEENVIIPPYKTQKVVVPSGFSEGEIFVKIFQNENVAEVSWGIDELYTRPPNVKIFIKKENEKILLKTKSP